MQPRHAHKHRINYKSHPNRWWPSVQWLLVWRISIIINIYSSRAHEISARYRFVRKKSFLQIQNELLHSLDSNEETLQFGCLLGASQKPLVIGRDLRRSFAICYFIAAFAYHFSCCNAWNSHDQSIYFESHVKMSSLGQSAAINDD